MPDLTRQPLRVVTFCPADEPREDERADQREGRVGECDGDGFVVAQEMPHLTSRYASTAALFASESAEL